MQKLRPSILTAGGPEIKRAAFSKSSDVSASMVSLIMSCLLSGSRAAGYSVLKVLGSLRAGYAHWVPWYNQCRKEVKAMTIDNDSLVKMTKEITEAAVSNVGTSDRSSQILGNTAYVTNLMQAVYDKLKDLNKG